MPLNNYFQTLTVSGSVIEVNRDQLSFLIKARSGDVFESFVGPTTSFQLITNLDGLDRDRMPSPEGVDRNSNPVLHDLLKYVRRDRSLTVSGIYSEKGDTRRFEARNVYLVQSDDGRFVFDESHWWLNQITQMADRWLDILFDKKRSYAIDDFSALYHTDIGITGGSTRDNIQECATLSRLIYGLSSAYLMTGARRYYLAAKAGVDYQRQAFRSLSHDGENCFWWFGRRRYGDGQEKVIIASENPDDQGLIPLYEQIYAIAGLTQFYRVTLDWEVLDDIRRTIHTIQKFYWDPISPKKPGYAGTGGYYSHLDPSTMRPFDFKPEQSKNEARKNWNSVGDHIPAYLINLVLSLDPTPRGEARRDLSGFQKTCREIIDETSRLIATKFADPQSDYVNERFKADWTPDHSWDWQQNRAVVGHNLKIAWNLTRCAFYYQTCAQRSDVSENQSTELRKRAESYLAFARRLADRMGEVGLDNVRGGIFDAVERMPQNGLSTQFAWGASKDFWQQEQGILAYLILHGATKNDRKYLELAHESIAFWNLFFLDRERQGIYFRTTENGLPIVEGIYGQKGGHAVAGYHAFELNYLAHVYTRTFVKTGSDSSSKFCLHFKITKNRDQESINVLPDFMPPGALKINNISVNGIDRTDDLIGSERTTYQIPLDKLDCNTDDTIDLTVEFLSAVA